MAACRLSPTCRAAWDSPISFGDRMNIMVVAEGIETATEAATVRRLGVTVGQGFHLAPPTRLAAIIG